MAEVVGETKVVVEVNPDWEEEDEEDWEDELDEELEDINPEFKFRIDVFQLFIKLIFPIFFVLFFPVRINLNNNFCFSHHFRQKLPFRLHNNFISIR